jgi:hypothetical protein
MERALCSLSQALHDPSRCTARCGRAGRAYAASSGGGGREGDAARVVHRDVKPANMLLFAGWVVAGRRHRAPGRQRHPVHGHGGGRQARQRRARAVPRVAVTAGQRRVRWRDGEQVLAREAVRGLNRDAIVAALTRAAVAATAPESYSAGSAGFS